MTDDALQRSFACAAGSYEAAAALAGSTQEILRERLALLRIAPQRVLDLGCATGQGATALAERYPQAQVLALDYALPMLHAARSKMPAPLPVQANAQALPFATASMDLIWSNLVLHWCLPAQQALTECARVLAPGGAFIGCVLGPGTLDTLPLTQLPQFPDMSAWGEDFTAAGLAEPVFDRDVITLSYRTRRGLLRDQRQLGVRDAFFPGLDFRSARSAFRAWQAAPDGSYPARFELIFFLAWKAETAFKPVRLMRRDLLPG